VLKKRGRGHASRSRVLAFEGLEDRRMWTASLPSIASDFTGGWRTPDGSVGSPTEHGLEATSAIQTLTPQEHTDAAYGPIGFGEDTSMYRNQNGERMALGDATPLGISYMLTSIYGGDWCDAEKTPGDDGRGESSGEEGCDDDYMCWAAAASNVLEWTGWGRIEGMTDTDDIFEYFQDHWTDDGGYMEHGWNWWFDGTNPSQGAAASQVDVPGGGFYTSEDFSEYYHEEDDNARALQAIATFVLSGYGTTIGIFGPGGHALTVWGFVFNPLFSPFSDGNDNYEGIWVTDSDDDKSLREAADDLRYYEVDYSDGCWFLQDYYGSDSWYIGEVMALERCPDDRFEQNDTASETRDCPEGASDSPNLGLIADRRVIENLTMQDAADWFRFRLDRIGTGYDVARIDFDGSEGDLGLWMYESDGQTLVDGSTGFVDYQELSLQDLPAGTYFVKVCGRDDQTNPEYKLTVGMQPTSDDAYEPNDTKEDVERQPQGAENSPNLGALISPHVIEHLKMSDEDDWYRFEMATDGTADDYVQIDFSHNQGDLILYVVYSGKTGSQMRLSNTDEDYERVSLEGMPAGTYYVRVRGYRGASNPDYTLTIDPAIAAADANLDVDGNNKADAMTDGIMILRYLMGFSGGPLVEGSLARDANRTDPDEIAAFLDTCRDTMLDVDANGQADAMTDGIIILRYLFGFTGDALVEDALSPVATRTDPAEIEVFLAGYVPLAAVAPAFSPLALAWLGAEPVATANSSTAETPIDAEQVDAVWGDSSQDGQTEDCLAADQACQESLYRALTHDALQSRTKTKNEQKPSAVEVHLLMFQR